MAESLTLPFDRTHQGAVARHEGINSILRSHEPWIDTAMRCLRNWLDTKSEADVFTSDDFRQSAQSQLGEPRNANAWGALFSVAADRGLLQHEGYAKSARKAAHCRIIRTWKKKGQS